MDPQLNLPRTVTGELDVPAFIGIHERRIQIGRWEMSHLFFPCEKEQARLLVFFGGHGGYGYIRSFYEREAGNSHLLYLSDNLGSNRMGLWWLADHGDFGLGDAYAELIQMCVQECGVAAPDVCFMGNCVGGFGALYLSYKLGAGSALAIAPFIAVGSVYKGTPLLEQIVGTSGVDLDEYIFNHFGRPSEVRACIITSNQDAMMRRGQISRFASILFQQKNVFVWKNLRVNSPAKVPFHAAVCGVLSPEEILAELYQPMERAYDRNKS